MPSLWQRLFGRRTETTTVPSYLSVEVPVITETKARLARSDRTGAIVYAYTHALADVEQSFHLKWESSLTHREILAFALPEDSRDLGEFLGQLYKLYEPVAYGDRLESPTDSLVSLLQSIYGNPRLAQLYARTAEPTMSHESYGAAP